MAAENLTHPLIAISYAPYHSQRYGNAILVAGFTTSAQALQVLYIFLTGDD